MAIGKASDFKIYDEYFDAGRTEVLVQQANLFNEAGGGALIVRPNPLKGDYAYESFFTEITSLDTRRDTTSVSSLTDTAMPQEENISVKLSRKQGPIAQTIDSFRKKALDPNVMSFFVGQQSAKAQMLTYLNLALKALKAYLDSNTTVEFDGTAANMTFSALNSAMSKFGDGYANLVAIVMHSKPFFDLIGDGLSNYKVDRVAGALVVTGPDGDPATGPLGLPTLVTDSSELLTTGTPDNYHTLLLTRAAAVIDESELTTLASEVVTGLENLVLRWQFEYAFNLSLRGLKWDVANGGSNPNDAALGTATNWDKVATARQGLPGVILHTL